MKNILFVIMLLLTDGAKAAALVAPLATNLEVSGVIGERGAMGNVKYYLSAKLANQVDSFPDNAEVLAHLNVKIADVNLQIPLKEYNSLENVALGKITLHYIKQYIESAESTIELTIHFGETKYCKNHDGGFVNSQDKKTLKFRASDGDFLGSVIKVTCKE